jgi:ABC-type transporter Mla subunit MlaD
VAPHNVAPHEESSALSLRVAALLLGTIFSCARESDRAYYAALPRGTPTVAPGTPVYYRGVQIGAVRYVWRDSARVLLALTLERDRVVGRADLVVVRERQPLGATVVDIFPSRAPAGPLEPGDTLASAQEAYEAITGRLRQRGDSIFRALAESLGVTFSPAPAK